MLKADHKSPLSVALWSQGCSSGRQRRVLLGVLGFSCQALKYGSSVQRSLLVTFSVAFREDTHIANAVSSVHMNLWDDVTRDGGEIKQGRR